MVLNSYPDARPGCCRTRPPRLPEQNVHHAFDVADRAYVMETGRITLDGPAAELRRNPKVEQSYLGAGGVAL